mgnify:CR=1 FL=1
MTNERTVLVLDDDPSLRHMLQVVLEQDGYAVVAAADVRSALAQCAVELPDLMVVDPMLPVEDGEMFLRFDVKPPYPDTPPDWEDQLEATFDRNEIRTSDLTETLDTRLGSFKELFGVLQQVVQQPDGDRHLPRESRGLPPPCR